jgi:hypothetical protein
VLISDFERHYLSGFPQQQRFSKLANLIKRRIDGFIFSGRDTFQKVISQLIESGKPIEYNKSNLRVRLNSLPTEVPPGF